MIRETLTAIGQAGRMALTLVAERDDIRTGVTPVREWSFSMPDLALVTVANSPVHRVYVGVSRDLAANMGREGVPFDTLMDEFCRVLAARVPARRPIGQWRRIEPSDRPNVLRGVRSFILRQQTPAGNLYLMADVASRREYECLGCPSWEADLAASLLSEELGRVDRLDGGPVAERLLTYLLRCEHDLQVLLPGPDGSVVTAAGTMVGRARRDDGHVLQLTLDLERDAMASASAGTEVECSFGAAGRLFRFRTRSAGPCDLALDDIAALPGLLLEVPARFHLDQRRRYFRVDSMDGLHAQLEVPSGGDAADAVRLPAGVEDLSFSGAGLMVEHDGVDGLAVGAVVRLRVGGEPLAREAMLSGLVRRVERMPRGRGRFRTAVGLEFVTGTDAERDGVQVIRQFVMDQQRRQLAARTRSADAQPV
jgi:c-di-GMP-binding flagellar brake protein YcgR